MEPNFEFWTFLCFSVVLWYSECHYCLKILLKTAISCFLTSLHLWLLELRNFWLSQPTPWKQESASGVSMGVIYLGKNQKGKKFGFVGVCLHCWMFLSVKKEINIQPSHKTEISEEWKCSDHPRSSIQARMLVWEDCRCLTTGATANVMRNCADSGEPCSGDHTSQSVWTYHAFCRSKWTRDSIRWQTTFSTFHLARASEHALREETGQRFLPLRSSERAKFEVLHPAVVQPREPEPCSWSLFLIYQKAPTKS